MTQSEALGHWYLTRRRREEAAMTYDERHDHRRLCACGRHLVTAPAPGRLGLGCAWGRHTPGRWGVLWVQDGEGE